MPSRTPMNASISAGLRRTSLVRSAAVRSGLATIAAMRSDGICGRVYGQTPRADPRQRLAERAKAVPNIVPVVRPFEEPAPAEVASNALDLVTLMFNYHDFGHMGIDRAQLNRAIFTALKPGGLYVVADHAGRPGTGISESGTLHRVEEALVRREVQAAGFELVGEGGFLRNPKDPRDRETPEPAQPKDEFILKFRKP